VRLYSSNGEQILDYASLIYVFFCKANLAPPFSLLQIDWAVGQPLVWNW
jgi:hypothetical protein